MSVSLRPRDLALRALRGWLGGCLAVGLWLAGASALRAQTEEPVVLASGLTRLAALTSDGNGVTEATELYFAETIGARTYLRRISTAGGAATTLMEADALLQREEYRGIRLIVPVISTVLGNNFWGDIGGPDSAYLFNRTASGTATRLATLAGGGVIGNASVNLICFDQATGRLFSRTMFSNAENPVATGYTPRASVSYYTEMFFQDEADRRLYRVTYDSATRISAVLPYTSAMEELGTMFAGSAWIYFSTGSRILRMPTAGGAITQVVSGFSGRGLAADFRFVYYVDGTSLKYVSVNGGTSGVLATVPENGVTGMVVADHFTNPVLYWAQTDGKILKLPAPRTAPVAPPPQPPATGASRIINLSILAQVTAADPSFTVGTVIGGAGTIGAKQLLVRAAGPSLAQLNVVGALADARLDLFSGQTLVNSNDDWGGTAALSATFTRVGAFPFSGSASKDAALALPALSVGGYTMQVGGVGGATGWVLAEVYDATPNAEVSAVTPRLINVSVLKNIDAGATLVAGFVIAGSTPRQVLIRAVGPTLAAAPFGVGGTMSDPTMELYSGQTAVISNNDWGAPVGANAASAAQITAAAGQVGAFSLGAGSRDAALLVTLAPGTYTARVSGAGGVGGVALVEVYEVP